MTPPTHGEGVLSSSNCCIVCGFPIPPSGRRGRPRKVHPECGEYQRAYYEANKAGLKGHATERSYANGCRCEHCVLAQAERELDALTG